jgi:hypothetical protein
MSFWPSLGQAPALNHQDFPGWGRLQNFSGVPAALTGPCVGWKFPQNTPQFVGNQNVLREVLSMMLEGMR